MSQLRQEEIRALEQTRQRLLQLAQSIGSLKADVMKTSPLPAWDSLQLSASILAQTLKSLTEHMKTHSELFEKLVAYPSTNFPGRTQEGLLALLLRKKLEPAVERWVEEGKALGVQNSRYDDTQGEQEDELEEKWKAAREFIGERIARAAVAHRRDAYTAEEREMGIENVNTGLQRPMKLGGDDGDSENESDEDEDEDDEMEDVQVVNESKGGSNQEMETEQKRPEGKVRSLDEIVRLGPPGEEQIVSHQTGWNRLVSKHARHDYNSMRMRAWRSRGSCQPHATSKRTKARTAQGAADWTPGVGVLSVDQVMEMGMQVATFLSTRATSMAHRFASDTPSTPQTPAPSLFLLLPLEIRLQIYGYVLESNSAKHTHLSPFQAHPTIHSSAYFLLAITGRQESHRGTLDERTDPQPLLSPSSEIRVLPSSLALRGNGCGCIPSALLRTCKQVYEEACTLPWERNEFVFVNWFCSGVYAARSFMKALQPWQRENMRWAHVEVLRRDLEDSWVASMVGGHQGTGEWKDLCRLWSGDSDAQGGGLWGLKLGIKGRVGPCIVGEAIDGSGGVSVALGESGLERVAPDLPYSTQRGLMDVNASWIVDGLAQMTAIKWLEIEIEDADVSRDIKVDFCIKLGEKLSSIAKRKVDVLLVESVVEELKPTKSADQHWGNPGDDNVWGLDS